MTLNKNLDDISPIFAPNNNKNRKETIKPMNLMDSFDSEKSDDDLNTVNLEDNLEDDLDKTVELERESSPFSSSDDENHQTQQQSRLEGEINDNKQQYEYEDEYDTEEEEEEEEILHHISINRKNWQHHRHHQYVNTALSFRNSNFNRTRFNKKMYTKNTKNNSMYTINNKNNNNILKNRNKQYWVPDTPLLQNSIQKINKTKQIITPKYKKIQELQDYLDCDVKNKKNQINEANMTKISNLSFIPQNYKDYYKNDNKKTEINMMNSFLPNMSNITDCNQLDISNMSFSQINEINKLNQTNRLSLKIYEPVKEPFIHKYNLLIQILMIVTFVISLLFINAIISFTTLIVISVILIKYDIHLTKTYETTVLIVNYLQEVGIKKSKGSIMASNRNITKSTWTSSVDKWLKKYTKHTQENRGGNFKEDFYIAI